MKFSPKIDTKIWGSNIETDLLKVWTEENVYQFDKKSKKPLFSIDTPPPYVNASVHIGHAYVYSWIDMIARSKRMSGHNVLFPMGLDKNGLPIEVQTEKEFKINLRKTSREEFIEKCRILLTKYGDISLDSFQRLGLSCNSWNAKYDIGGKYDTDDPEYRRLTQETFITMWKKGLIYEGTGTTNFCLGCGTAISDAEVDYKEGYTDLNYIEFQIEGNDSKAIIATTRPELLSTSKIILYNPKDDRYGGLKGKSAIVPIFGHKISFLSHPYAKPDYGTGLVMVSSFGDYADIRLLRELRIEPTYAIDSNGKMNEASGKYSGLKVKEARKKILEDLESSNLLVKKENVLHRTPICERSKDTIEFIATKEIYLNQLDYVQDIHKIADQTKFYTGESKQILIDWIDSLTMDWVISRRRYYGTEIPLWWCNKCNEPTVPSPGRYYQPWKESCPVDKCLKCGGSEFTGDERIFDTWFDSCTSEAYILGYLWDKEFFERNFPCGIRPQGKEIVRNWLYFTILKSLHLFGKKPFKNVWIHMHVVDEKGTKMSKSLGNIIDPKDVIERFGADGFRIWSCLEGDISKGDIKCSFNRIEGQSKFLTKLWNIARFISMFPNDDSKDMPTDGWIKAELSHLVTRVLSKYEEYAFADAASLIRDFTWNIFAAHYMEMVKGRAYGDGFSKEKQNAARGTLHICFRTILLLLAPIIPFFTDYVWRILYGGKTIHLEQFPTANWNTGPSIMSSILMEFNSEVWNIKKKKGVSLKESINVRVPDQIKELIDDLQIMHNIRE